jgi:predicted metal-dependent phosphoesterase TrpH
MGVRIDLHCHSRWSRDGIGTIAEIARAAQAKGLAGVFVTDHDTTRHHKEIEAWNRTHAGSAFRLYPGIEVSSRAGHILALGVRDPIPARRGLVETVAAITAAGGVAVPSHPFRPRIGIREPGLLELRGLVPAVETWNAQEPLRRNARAAAYQEAAQLGATGGSDAHQVHDVGNAYTLLFGAAPDLDSVLDAVAKGRTQPGGGHTPWWVVARQNLRIARRFVAPRRQKR